MAQKIFKILLFMKRRPGMTLAALATSRVPDEVIADEKQLFDRPKLRMTTVVEFESDLAG